MLSISIYEWLDQETKEANLLICDNDIRFIAFCDRYVGFEGTKIILDSLYSSDVVLSFDKPMIKKDEDGYYSYIVVQSVEY